MHQCSSSCSCGHRHSRIQPGSGIKPPPVIKKITHVSMTTPEKSCCDNTNYVTDSIPDRTRSQADSAAAFSWLIRGMDCPSCARKIENAVGKLPEVNQARVLFATEKLVVNAQKDIRQLVEEAVLLAGFSLTRSDAPSNVAKPTPGFWQENRTLILLAIMLLISGFIHLASPQAGQVAFTLTTLFGLWPIARSALRLIRSGMPFAIETLMSVAAIGALLIGATAEAAAVLLLFMLGEQLESFAASRARRGVTALMALKPEEAVRVNGEQREIVALSNLRPGDIIEVAPGARLPADARLIAAFASFDESALTGESVPVERKQGETVAAGCLSIDRQVQLQVISEPGESAIDRILHLIEEAESNRAPIERFLDRFSRIYTPLIMVLALLVAVIPPLFMAADWQPWIYKGLTLLLIGCPCALVISTPAAITSGLAAASRRGVLIKGGAALESLNAIRTLAFDKTGTLTEGRPQVTSWVALTEESESSLLAKAAAVESGSSHPLAKAIMALATERGLDIPLATEQKALAGSGVEADVDGHKLLISAPVRLEAGVLSTDCIGQITRLEAEGNTVVVLLQDGVATCLIAMRDKLREDALEALTALKALNVKSVMLTGDNPCAAAAIARELAIDFRAGLLPADKVAAIGELNQLQPVAMVGDGINDAPAMKAASVGIAMGSGSDVALETADAALTHNRLGELAMTLRLARATHANIRQNIVIALGLKGVFLVTTLLGFTGLWLAVLADSGATALVTINALRLLRKN